MSRGRLLFVALAAVLLLGGCGHLVVLNDPLSASQHNDLGVAYEAEGKLDLARRQYRRALKLDPRLQRARVNLGNVEAAEGRWASAEREFRRALDLDPDDADAMNNLAVALLKRERHLDEALLWAERAVARGGPRDSIYRATWADIQRAQAGEAPRP